MAFSNLFEKMKTPLGISLCSVVLIFILAFFVMVGALSSLRKVDESETIVANVWVNNVDLSGMSMTEASNALREHYEDYPNGVAIHLESSDISQEISLGMANVQIDFEATAQRAYETGRAGNEFERIFSSTKRLFTSTVLPLAITMNSEVIIDHIEELANNVNEQEELYAVNEAALELRINLSVLPKIVDVDATYASIVDSIATGQPSEAIVVTASGMNRARRAELLRAIIPSEPINASVETGIKEVVFVSERNGIEFNVKSLEQALAQDGTTAIIPITLRPAEITEEDLRELIFRDVLAEYTTNYNSPWGRTNNIRLAANNINGTILAPEDYFSFNEVVGMRTTAAGFAMGGVFMNGEVTEGVGGGICQASTTLYSAVLYADLEVIERHNHSFAIGYAPIGQDATVSYGSLDFVFKNNTEFPIQVVAENSPGRITIRILGTNTDPEKKVEIVHSRISTTPFSTIERVNPNASATRVVVEQSGITGYTVDTYKVIKRNGVEESREFLHRSVYSPLNRMVLTPQTPLTPFVPTVPMPGSGEETPTPLPPMEDWGY